MKLNEIFEDRAGIYIIKNKINEKYYIGESLNIKKRIYQHCYGGDQVLHKAIAKYGIDNFEIYVEYFDTFSKSDLIKLEESLIIKYNSLAPHGYNICSKGTDFSGCKQSEDTKRKISSALKGIKRSPEEIKKSSNSRTGLKRTQEQIENISNAHKGLIYGPCSEAKKQKISSSLKQKYKLEIHPATGYRHTQEVKDKLSLSKRGISNISAKKPILQIDPITNTMIKEWA
jgi:group I intron endonuclease